MTFSLSLAGLTGFSNSALAGEKGTDFGQIGPVYQIKEQDFIEFIQERMTAKVQSGEVAREHEAMAERAKQYAKRPPGIRLPRAAEYSAVQLDPIYIVEHDIKDADGNTLYAAGTKVHPLRVMPFQRTLCFIDSDDIAQLQWARRLCTEGHDKRIVLINGDLEEATQAIGRRIYFDQYGRLSESLALIQVPAVVRQSGDYLYVEYFPVD